jgi:hypothetical protein
VETRDELRAFEFGDDRSALDVVTNIRVELDDPTRNAGTEIDTIGGYLALHDQWRWKRRKPQDDAEGDEAC